jgi:ATP-dependent Lon protease
MPDFGSDNLDVVAALSAIVALEDDNPEPGIRGAETRRLRKPTKPSGPTLPVMIHAAALVVANVLGSTTTTVYCITTEQVEFLDHADMPAIDLALAEILAALQYPGNPAPSDIGRRIMHKKRIDESIEQLRELMASRGEGADKPLAKASRTFIRSEIRRAFVYSALMNYARVNNEDPGDIPPAAAKADAGDGEVITPARRDFEVDTSRPYVRLYKPEDVVSFTRRIDLRFKDGPERKSMRARAQQMSVNGCSRTLSTVPENWREKIDQIEAEMPNFSEACMVLREALAIASHAAVPVPRFPHMLLEGESGIGKSRFAAKIGDLLGVNTVRIDMASSETNSMLSGSDQHWANAKSGHVFNTLVDRGYGNPVFFLDEIDKIQTSHYDPLAPLYSLLERDSAQCFTDKTIPDIPIDASYITWVLTANDKSQLPTALLDRLRPIHVPTPTPVEKQTIILQMFNTISDQLALVRPVALPDEVLEYLAEKCSLRAAAAALHSGIGQALIRGRQEMRIEDLSEATPKHRTMGFLPA